MSDPSHEEEFLQHLTQAGVLAAQLARVLVSGKTTADDIAGLKAAGYTEQTGYDGKLRELLGEQRWAKFAADPARIVAAAAITDAANAGHDMDALLVKVVSERRFENDPIDAARSIARVLAFRVVRAMGQGSRFRRPAAAQPAVAVGAKKQDAGAGTAFDGRLRGLLGEQRWAQYAQDPRRGKVSRLLTKAQAEGRDVDALLTHAVTSREFEDDPVSPARRVAGVLHYRLSAAIISEKFPCRTEVPSRVADVVAHAAAPRDNRPGEHAATHGRQQAPRPYERNRPNGRGTR